MWCGHKIQNRPRERVSARTAIILFRAASTWDKLFAKRVNYIALFLFLARLLVLKSDSCTAHRSHLRARIPPGDITARRSNIFIRCESFNDLAGPWETTNTPSPFACLDLLSNNYNEKQSHNDQHNPIGPQRARINQCASFSLNIWRRLFERLCLYVCLFSSVRPQTAFDN